ncbi:hypothetical protein WL76_06810 [Burkholderia ubonensis]|nr:hypothetical protein WL76_06810 [Burkholderia ubonensis]
MLQFYLGTRYDSAHPMGNIAQAELGTVIKAWLVGLEKEVAPILPRSVEWLADAIERREKLGGNPTFT